MNKLSVVTFNAFGTPFYGSRIRYKFLRTKISLRFRKIGQLLNDSDADVLCFQEVFTLRHLNRLKIELTKYPYCIYKRYLISPRGGLVIFSKYEIANWEFIDFSTKGKYWDKSVTGSVTKRGMLKVELADMPVTVINTHPIQNSGGDWNEDNKYVKIIKTQLEEIVNVCRDIRGELIIAGDFNIGKETTLYSYVMGEEIFTDAFADYFSPTYIEEYVFGKKAAERLDYIFFVGHHFQLLDKKQVFTKKERLQNGLVTYLSDHIGLQATFGIK